MKVEMKATVTLIMDFATEEAAMAWAATADVWDLIRDNQYEEENSIECFFLEEEDEAI